MMVFLFLILSVLFTLLLVQAVIDGAMTSLLHRQGHPWPGCAWPFWWRCCTTSSSENPWERRTPMSQRTTRLRGPLAALLIALGGGGRPAGGGGGLLLPPTPGWPAPPTPAIPGTCRRGGLSSAGQLSPHLGRGR